MAFAHRRGKETNSPVNKNELAIRGQKSAIRGKEVFENSRIND